MLELALAMAGASVVAAAVAVVVSWLNVIDRFTSLTVGQVPTYRSVQNQHGSNYTDENPEFTKSV